MTNVAVSLVGGGSIAGTYALIALGIVLAFRATSTLNFAHGELMVLPAFFVGRWQSTHAISTPVAIVIGLMVGAVVAALFYIVVLQRMTGRPPFLALIATFGFAGLMDGVLAILFGPSQYSIQLGVLPHGSVSIGGARISTATLTLTGFTLVLAMVVVAVVRFTPLGLRLRAAGQDPILASQGGVDVRRFYVGSWAVAGILAGIAGIVYGAQNQVAPSMTAVTLAVFPAILLGGLDSVEGALIGSLLVGVAQGFISTYLGSQYLTVITYMLLLSVLLFRPQGLLGTRAVVRA